MRGLIAAVVVLLSAGVAVVSVPHLPSPAAPAETIPPLNLTWEATDPAAGAADVIAAEQASHDAAVQKYLADVAAQKERDRRARLAATKPKPDRSRRVVTGDVWGALARCESGGNPTSRSANGIYTGAFQFADATWQSLGYSGEAADHPYATQLEGAQRLQGRSGWGQWPRCARKLGLL